MTPTWVNLVFVTLFVALLSVSNGHLLDSGYPYSWSAWPNRQLDEKKNAYSPMDFEQLSKLRQELENKLENVQGLYDKVQNNFGEHQRVVKNEVDKLQAEVGEVQQKVKEASTRKERLEAEAKKMRYKINVFLQAANDEKDMYGGKLEECDSGRIPKSFVGNRMWHEYPAMTLDPTSTENPAEQPTPPTTSSDPGLPSGIWGQPQFQPSKPTLPRPTMLPATTIPPTPVDGLLPGVRTPFQPQPQPAKPTLPRPTAAPHTTTSQWVSETIRPTLVDGVANDRKISNGQDTLSVINTKCNPLLHSIASMHKSLDRLKEDREVSIEQLEVIQKETNVMIPSSEYLSNMKDELMQHKEQLVALLKNS